MDLIDAELATKATNLAFSPSLRAAISLGKKLLNKYYSMTDNSNVYRIAMSELTTYMFILDHLSFHF